MTAWITAYTIYYMPGMAVKYSLTIVDTPGFGDTSGIERDKEITRQIKEFFSMESEKGGIDRIDGIGFVAQASLARLTHTQRYVFDSILSTFGKDIADNIFMMLTFADAKKPPVVEAIKAAKTCESCIACSKLTFPDKQGMTVESNFTIKCVKNDTIGVNVTCNYLTLSVLKG